MKWRGAYICKRFTPPGLSGSHYNADNIEMKIIHDSVVFLAHPYALGCPLWTFCLWSYKDFARVLFWREKCCATSRRSSTLLCRKNCKAYVAWRHSKEMLWVLASLLIKPCAVQLRYAANVQIRPYVDVWNDYTMERFIGLFAAFVPLKMSIDEHNKYGAALWFDELWYFYNLVEMNSSWECRIQCIFSASVSFSVKFDLCGIAMCIYF